MDTVEVALVPILLGDGIPLVAPGERSPLMRLADTEVMASGIVLLTYALG